MSIFHDRQHKIVGCTLEPISILQSINSPRCSELHAGNSKNFVACIIIHNNGAYKFLGFPAWSSLRLGEFMLWKIDIRSKVHKTDFMARVWFGPHLDSPKHKLYDVRCTSRWKFWKFSGAHCDLQERHTFHFIFQRKHNLQVNVSDICSRNYNIFYLNSCISEEKFIT